MLTYLGRYLVRVEDETNIGPHILTNTLVYLVGQGRFTLNADERQGLRNYVHRRRGTLFIEALDADAEESFFDFLQEKEMLPEPIYPHHPLLSQPYLFTTPPPGLKSDEAKLWVNEGVIFSTYNYGLLWQGEQEQGLASREAIRTATEWGSNIMAYALGRRWGQ
jgi:hypothetical protein